MISDERLKLLVEKESANMFRFLRDIVAIPSQDGIEGAVIKRIISEMKACNFDEILVDEMGNCIGCIGPKNGTKQLAFDAHIDTVGTGMLEQWSFDPYKGKEDETYIYGRGSCDQKAGLAAMVYSAKLVKELGLGQNVRVAMVASTMEEECEGVSWKYIMEHDLLRPDAVISTEPTEMQVKTGHRGRTDIKVSVEGKSAHGAMPHLGVNAVVRMAEIICDIEMLSHKLLENPVLGKGTINISSIESQAASKCAVPDYCEIQIDRRLTLGESPESAVSELINLPSVKKYAAKVEIMNWVKTTYTGMKLNISCRFPTWKTESNEKIYMIAGDAVEKTLGEKPVYSVWNFSTNGVAISGVYGIPCIGLGPGNEKQAHAVDEYVSKIQMKQAMESYIRIIEQF